MRISDGSYTGGVVVRFVTNIGELTLLLGKTIHQTFTLPIENMPCVTSIISERL